MSVNGNQNWISLGGSFQIQPSEFGKLALILWGADLLARKQDKRLLTQWKHMLVPLVPVAFMLLGLIMLGGDMGTAIILTAILFGLLWLAGAPDPAVRRACWPSPGSIGVMLIKTSANRMARLACIGATEPRHRGRRLLAGRARHLRPGLGRMVRFRSRCQCGKMGPTPRSAHRLHLRRHR